MNKIIWILLTLFAGAILPIQAGFNARLAKGVGSGIHATFISFVIGTIAMLLIVSVTKQNYSLSGVKELPVYAWLGGMLGAFFISILIFAFPQLGAGLTFGLVITGQLVVALLLEHFNLLVEEPHPINFLRLLGITLIIAGVIIIRKF
jgi:transporter family-2 protein